MFSIFKKIKVTGLQCSLHILFPVICFALGGCKGGFVPKSKQQIADIPAPAAPDYSLTSGWAALPEKKDPSDRVPASLNLPDRQDVATADVFFIHPTSYLKVTSKSRGWNADISDEAVNRKTDEGSILYQASVFNASCRIYAPRYRQANIQAYFTNDQLHAKRAFDTAYADVKAAFEYYLLHYNQGRPFIIASHSQGTTHAIRLLQEFFDNGDALSEKMIAAYLVGMPVYDTLFTVLKPCGNANDHNCYVSWRTYASGYYPKGYVQPLHETVCTNPLTWTLDSTYANRMMNSGAVLRNFNQVVPHVCDAQVKDGVVRINRPRFRGSRFYHVKNYHIVDYNFFYLSIRENAAERVRMFRDAPSGLSR